jgi:two-component system cell cycle sensor histidine kinase/response regulator CckA
MLMGKKPTYEQLEQRIKKLEGLLSGENQGNRIEVSDISIVWDSKRGTCTFENLPVAMMWVNTTLAGLMSGMQAMVGTKRFSLALQSEGRKSVEEDWTVFSQFSEFRDGFRVIANIAAVAGWGNWQLISLDIEKNEGVFRVFDSWEGGYQKALGAYWGSGMLAGKMAGYCSKLFETNCWADQSASIAKGDGYDEFVVTPSERSVEQEIENLLVSDEATRADMAVALEKLRREIADREQVEQTLRESEERYKELADSLPQVVFEMDTNGLITYTNQNGFVFFRYTREDFDKGVSAFQMLIPEDRERAVENIKRRQSGEELGGREYTALRKDGTTFPVTVHLSPIVRNNETVGFRGIMIDITDRKQAEKENERLQDQLHQAQRMESIGTLAGGVAHDFNNLLMGILGRTSLMLNRTNSTHPLYEHLKGIEDYVEHATDLSKQLLGFARGGKYEVAPVDLNDLVDKSAKMFGRTKKEVRIHMKFQEGIWTVEVDIGQIEQVLLNLYINAWQAMPGGGDLYLQTENVRLDTNYIKPFVVEPGRYVKIAVTDTGVGMEKDIQERIFEPFFTTKERGRGAGLGLASAYGIIKNHGGIIGVYSEKNEGTTFNIYLPASDKEVLELEEKSHEILKGTDTILLADDEEFILDVGKEVLEQLGYRVLIARSGKEAIEVYSAQADEIDLVLLDMIMPDMGGGETFDKLKEMDQGIKVLLSSGYSINGEAQQLLDRGCMGFIQKPFNMTAISQKIREILDKK